MRASLSAIEDLEAGTSMLFGWPFPLPFSPGMLRVWAYFAGDPLLRIF